MVFIDEDKEALINNTASVLSRITVADNGAVLTEDNYITEWKYEDFRYVPGQGFIGQFVERLLDGKLTDLPSNINLTDKEIHLELGVQHDGETHYYSYGNFLITKVTENDVDNTVTFEACDYAKKFNKNFVSHVTYPCLSLELLNDVCGQTDVSYASDDVAACYAVTEEGLPIGTYVFSIYHAGENSNESYTKYYEFETTEDLGLYDSLMLIENQGIVRQRYVDKDTLIVDEIDIEVTEIGETTENVLDADVIPYYNYTNNNFVVIDNQFTEGNTLRDVVKSISQLAYSWARIDVNNNLCIDFRKKVIEDVDLYDIITIDDYYNCDKSQEDFGPVTRVSVGMSQVEGETLYISTGINITTETGQEILTEDELNLITEGNEEDAISIKIFDNPLTYTEKLRAIALYGAERLLGLFYSPISKLETVGQPWLEGDEFIKLVDLNDVEKYTYPFNRTINYTGVIKGEISAVGETITNSTYEYKPEILKQLLQTQIVVNKQEQTITSLVKQVNDNYEQFTETKQTVDGVVITVNKIDSTYDNTVERVSTIEETLDGLNVENRIVGGSNLLKNSVGYFANDYWQLDEEHEGNVLSRNDTDVKKNSISGSALLLQNNTIYQKINEIENGEYYISFKYKMLLSGNCSVVIDDLTFDLTEDDWTEQEGSIIVENNSINVVINCDTDNSCLITDLMLTKGNTKISWSQNANETYTDGVKIGKGVTITATGSDTKLEATATGIEIQDANTSNVSSKFTKYGTETNELIVHETVTLSDGLLINKVGGQVWMSNI